MQVKANNRVVEREAGGERGATRGYGTL
jgi:hypothetical protein